MEALTLSAENTTHVLLTVDTELSSSLHRRGLSSAENFTSSITGRCANGDYGIAYQMDVLERHGCRGVFFVDPMPALVYGKQVIADIVGPIVERQHDVQLHIHTEWLEWVSDSPVEGRRGQHIGDFSLDDQMILLGLARDLLVEAGAPEPTAFRAGNYGANDDSLTALADLGLTWDTSFNPAYADSYCRINLSPDQLSPVMHNRMIELPVASIHDRPGHIRAAQLCAMSATEMRQALEHAATDSHAVFVIVSHSFELLSRDRQRANFTVIKRFEKMIRTIAGDQRLQMSVFNDLESLAKTALNQQQTRLAPGLFRTGGRMVEQLLANLLYDRQVRS